MLLSRFQRLFGQDETVENHENWLTDSKQILRILQNLQQHQYLLEARIPGQRDIYSTALIGINSKTGILALDELKPRRGHDLFLSHGIIHLSGRADGIEVEFDLELVTARNQAGIAYYQAGIPKAIIYIQRRDIYRFPLSGATPFIGHRGDDEEDPEIFRGRATDVSTHGVGILLDNLEFLDRGEELTKCKLKIADHDPFYFSLEIRFAEQIQHRRATRIGGRFLDIDRQERNRLKQIILQLERNQAAIGRR